MAPKRLPPLTLHRAATSVEQALQAFFAALGVPEEEMENRGLDIHNTPRRVAKAYAELLSSYQPGAEADLIARFTQFDEAGDDSMVLEGPIHFQSLCAHHMMTIDGHAYVGYVPDRHIVGASKLARVVEHYSRMLQIQERLGRQIAEFIHKHASPKAVIVTIAASHYCMKCRGVRQQGSKLVTTAVRPQSVVVDNRGVLDEFYRQLEIARKG